MINDKTVTRITFKDINKFVAGKKTAQQLPYIIAWELMDASDETADERIEREAAEGDGQERRKQHLEEREKTLNAREEEQKKKEKALEEKEKTLKGLDPQKKELDDKKVVFEEKEKRLTANAVALYRRREQLDDREKALNQREQIIEKREKEAQIRSDVDDLFHTTSEDNDTPLEQPEADAKGQIEQEVDERRDTATFCATFRNHENHEENGRAIFKLKTFNPEVPTKIESTVQLSDLQGNLRSIKRGTTVGDNFAVVFNVKGVKKRKRGGDDDGDAASPLPPTKKTKSPAREADKPQQSHTEKIPKTPSGSRNIKNESQDKQMPLKQIPQSSTGIKKESFSPKAPISPPRRSPPNKSPIPPRRSTRVNKGKTSNRM